MVKWVTFEDRLPEKGQKILISNGEIITAASYTGVSPKDHRITHVWMFDGCEHGGHEWEWDFDQSSMIYWAELPPPPTKTDMEAKE